MTLLHTFLRRVPVLALGLLAVVTTLPGWAAQAGDDGPDVTIIAGEKRTIYEYWQNGHLRMVRVVPAIGKPYYLVPRDNTRGYGELERADMLLPSWVIVEFLSAVSLQSPNLLPSALAWYDTGQLLRYWPAAQGIENANYFVHTGQGDYVLTFLLRESYAGTAYFTILDRLYEAGLPVAPPLPARDGRLQVELDGVPVILQRRLPGSHVTIPTEGQLTALGRLLARVHQHTADLGTRVPLHPRGMMWLRDTAARVSGRLGFRAADLLESSLKSTHSLLRRHDVQELPQGVIHADVFRDNVLFRDNTLTGLVDFHQAARGYWIYDLAVAANDWCCDVNGQLNPDKALALLKGYHAQRPLTRSEIWLFSPFRVMAALSFWLSRLDTTLLANETIRTKNPREMEQLLLALRGGFHYFDERLFG